ncbi:MAG: hypothetical protein M9894_34110 [Planctomycetes bacterium]|nr:hypothetical protein [Planctomycetota bacterium]
MSSIQFFGQWLVARGHVTADALQDALAYQAAVNVPLGALALSKGLLTERQLLLVHTEQRRTDRRFGELAVQMGFLRRAQLDELLREQAEAHILIGEALVQKGHLSRDALEDAFQAYRAEQMEAEEATRRALEAAPRSAAVQAAADVTARLLLRMGGLSAKLTRVTWDAPLAPQDRTFWQRVEGAEPFAYVLTLSDAQTLALGRRMLEPLQGGDVPEAVDALVLDVVKEFVNIVVTQVCLRLGRDGREHTPGAIEHGEPPAPGATRVVVDLVLPSGRVGLAIDG